MQELWRSFVQLRQYKRNAKRSYTCAKHVSGWREECATRHNTLQTCGAHHLCSPCAHGEQELRFILTGLAPMMRSVQKAEQAFEVLFDKVQWSREMTSCRWWCTWWWRCDWSNLVMSQQLWVAKLWRFVRGLKRTISPPLDWWDIWKLAANHEPLLISYILLRLVSIFLNSYAPCRFSQIITRVSILNEI